MAYIRGGGCGGEFRDVVKIAVGALILTGAVLTFDRLAGAEAGLLYGVVLGLKVAAAVAMIWLVGLLRPRRPGAARQCGVSAALLSWCSSWAV